MIPTFPIFKSLEPGDANEVRALGRTHPPYSDYNFTSLWSWNLNGHTALSFLHGNLALKFSDYLTGEPFYSFLGMNKVNDTALGLLELSARENLTPVIKLLPEISVLPIDRSLFHVQEDTDHADYVVAVDKLLDYNGPELAGKRRAVRQFVRRTPAFRFEQLDLSSPKVDADIRELFSLWLVQKNVAVLHEEEQEYVALSRCLESPSKQDLLATGVYVGDRLATFWIFELLHDGYAVSHFEKADTLAHGGIFPFLKQKTAELLRQKNIKYVNLEQDLGLEGLRNSKSSYSPQHFLKKYSLRPVKHTLS